MENLNIGSGNAKFFIDRFIFLCNDLFLRNTMFAASRYLNEELCLFSDDIKSCFDCEKGFSDLFIVLKIDSLTKGEGVLIFISEVR